MSWFAWSQTSFPTHGYVSFKHGGFSWLANKEGKRFLLTVENWSPEVLARQEGWHVCNRKNHMVYVAQDERRAGYFIKFYYPSTRGGLIHRENAMRAAREFHNTLLADQKEIQTVLPLALGEGQGRNRSTVIVYPYLKGALGLDRIYDYDEPAAVSVPERHWIEKSVGQMMRKFIESGMYPVDVNLDHFIARKVDGGKPSVYWVDLERVGLKSLSLKRRGINSLARLLAQLEWLRISGGGVHYSNMMRIGHAYFNVEKTRRLDRRLCLAVITATRTRWYAKGFPLRRRYQLRSLQSR